MKLSGGPFSVKLPNAISSAGLMLLPIAGLAAFGFWMRGFRKAPAAMEIHAPGRFISAMEPVPLSARELSQGFDGKVRVSIDWAGPKPTWWGRKHSYMWLKDPLAATANTFLRPIVPGVGAVLTAGGSNHPRVIGTRENNAVRFGSLEPPKAGFWNPNCYTIDCRYKLAGAAKTERDIRMVAGVSPGIGRIVRRSLALPREGGAEAPPVSRDSQIRVVRTGVTWLPPAHAESGDCNVTADVKYTGRQNAVRWNPDEDFEVVDANGKNWTLSELNLGMAVSMQATSYTDEPAGETRTLNWWFSTRKLPPGRVVFKSGVGIGEGWLQPITVVVRSGKERPPAARPSSLRILDVRARPAAASQRAGGFDTTTVILFKTVGRLPRKPGWIYDYSQHLVDWRGRVEYWVRHANGSGESMNMAAPRWNAARQCWEVAYSYRLAAFPKGRVLFRAELGLPGEKLAPVECVVRK